MESWQLINANIHFVSVTKYTTDRGKSFNLSSYKYYVQFPKTLIFCKEVCSFVSFQPIDNQFFAEVCYENSMFGILFLSKFPTSWWSDCSLCIFYFCFFNKTSNVRFTRYVHKLSFTFSSYICYICAYSLWLSNALTKFSKKKKILGSFIWQHWRKSCETHQLVNNSIKSHKMGRLTR